MVIDSVLPYAMKILKSHSVSSSPVLPAALTGYLPRAANLNFPREKRNFPRSKPFAILAAALCAIALPVQATVLVHYDFEGETESGTSPNREWTVTDKAGPPFTNVVAEQSLGQTLQSFNGGTALRLTPAGGTTGLFLDDGANGELKTDYANGMIIETTFSVHGGLASTSQVIVARFGTDSENRTFRLLVNAGPVDNPTGN